MYLSTTPGASDSTSFIDVVEADEFIEAMPVDFDTWVDLSDIEKEFRLQLAADAMDAEFCFMGYRAYENQRLCFPRAGCQERFGISLEEIPEDVKQAQAYIACEIINRSLLARQETTVDAGDESDAQVSMVSIKGVSVQFIDPSTRGAVRLTSNLADIIEDKHSIVYLLLSKYITQIKTRPISTAVLLPAVEV